MGQRTLAFTKQMLRIFSLIELEEPDHLIANSWSSIPRSTETNRDLIATRSEDEQAQANKHIYIYCWGPSASEGPQKHDLTMFSKYASRYLRNQVADIQKHGQDEAW
jgi:hypothetical protein